jgi:hypothetical protein
MSNRSTPIMPAGAPTDGHPLPGQPLRYELRAPDTPLGRARLDRGWSREKTVRALILQAEYWSWEVATESSLKVQLHRWEHEQVRPSHSYQVLLCAIFGASPERLGFTSPTPCAEDPEVLDAPTVCPGHAELLARIDALEAQLQRIADVLLSQDQGATLQLIRG